MAGAAKAKTKAKPEPKKEPQEKATARRIIKTISLDMELAVAAEDLAIEQGRSFSSLNTIALQDYIKKHKK